MRSISTMRGDGGETSMNGRSMNCPELPASTTFVLQWMCDRTPNSSATRSR